MKPLDWKTLCATAEKLIVAEQNATYDFIREKVGVKGAGSISDLLKRLAKKNIVRRGANRKWVVIVNADGTPKSEAEVPPKRAYRRKRQKNRRGNGRQAEAFVDAASADDDEKITLVQLLADAAEGKKARILQEVLNDLRFLSQNRKLIAALRD